MERVTATASRLPEGPSVSAVNRGLSGSLLTIELADGIADQDFPAGCLLEVDCDHMLYLGQIYNRDGRTLVVGVEHAVDRRLLSAIQESWAAGQ